MNTQDEKPLPPPSDRSAIISARRKLVAAGLESLELEIRDVIEDLAEVLRSSGQPCVANALPWSTTGADTPTTCSRADASQAVSIAFQLLNMVEERVAHATRDERARQLGPAAERGSWLRVLNSLKQNGFTEDELVDILRSVRVEPVFTAHPTEAKRASVRERHSDVYRLLCRLKEDIPDPVERNNLQDDFLTALESLWQTGEIHVEKPTIERELRNALHYLREIFPATVEDVQRKLRFAWKEAGFNPARLDEIGGGPRICFGLWIGGDRDGHPYVTSAVTKDTLAQLRVQAIKLHRRELADAAYALSATPTEEQVPELLQARINELAAERGEEGAIIVRRNEGEPWRAIAYLIRAKLFAEYTTVDPKDYRADLELMSRTLCDNGGTRLDEQILQPLLHKLDTFGFHLADLDVRQNSGFHDRAMAQMLDAAGIPEGADFADWSEERRVKFLTTELESPRPFIHPEQKIGTEADAVRDAFRVLADQWHTYGSGLGSLIVSMTRQLSDLLVVHLFARETGLTEIHEGQWTLPLQVVPLFETLDDLEHSADIVDAYLSHPVTQRSLHIQSHNGQPKTQQVMLGYSDSNKDGGIVASQWALHCAQQAINETAGRHGVHIRYFHGRGGTISRGAGPTNWFMRALPHGSMQGDFRMTEQGETIAKKYAYPDSARYHLETLAACVTRTAAHHRKASSIEDPGIDLLPDLAAWSRDAYRNLLEADDFITFYRQATPIDALEQVQLGSRPSRRTGTASLDDLRAIPWVFSWTQARFYLPGWYGVGSALDRMRRERPEDFQRLANTISTSTLPRYIFTGVETNLMSVKIDLMRKYAALVESEEIRTRFMEKIETEWKLAHQHLSDLFPEPIAARRPRYTKTLQLREIPLDELHKQQIEMLATWRVEGGEPPRDLVLSISAIASGLRTTG